MLGNERTRIRDWYTIHRLLLLCCGRTRLLLKVCRGPFRGWATIDHVIDAEFLEVIVAATAEVVWLPHCSKYLIWKGPPSGAAAGSGGGGSASEVRGRRLGGSEKSGDAKARARVMPGCCSVYCASVCARTVDLGKK